MADFFPKMLEKQTLTPELIVSKLSFFYEQTHECHFNTKSFAVHSALNYYDTLIDFKDKVGELLLGYMAPKRFGQMQTFKTSPTADPVELMKQIVEFSHQLEQYAEKNNYRDLANTAQDIEGSAVKNLFLLTLS
jgi:DNA-binding ferritin-like protein